MIMIDCNDKAKQRIGAVYHYCDDLHTYYWYNLGWASLGC